MEPLPKGFRHLRPRLKPMTICIAARCEVNLQNPKVVFCADRLISTPTLQFQHGEPKVFRLNHRHMAMISSDDSLRSEMIIKRVQAQMSDDERTTQDIVKVFTGVCRDFRHEAEEAEILDPLGITFESWQKEPRNLPDTLVNSVAAALTNWEYGFECDFIVFGVDPEPHIWVLNQNGDSKSADYLGFAAIGNGASTAIPELTKLPWSANITMSEAIVRVYAGKRASERTLGVGQMTDLSVLHVIRTAGGWVPGYWTPPAPIAKLLFEGMRRREKTEFGAYVKMVKGVVDELNRGIKQEAEQATNLAVRSQQEVRMDFADGNFRNYLVIYTKFLEQIDKFSTRALGEMEKIKGVSQPVSADAVGRPEPHKDTGQARFYRGMGLGFLICGLAYLLGIVLGSLF
jgi:hypothetical protein